MNEKLCIKSIKKPIDDKTKRYYNIIDFSLANEIALKEIGDIFAHSLDMKRYLTINLAYLRC